MESIVNCNIISKKCGEFRLENINFHLEPGVILGVIGVNGVGKTTLLRSILGSYFLEGNGNQGTINIAGKDSVEDIAEYKEQIAYVLQDTPFDMWMTAIEIGRVYGKYYKGFDIEKYKRLLREYKVPFEGKEEFADYILWIQKKDNVGSARYFGTVDELKDGYRIVEADMNIVEEIPADIKIGGRNTETHNEVLIRVDNQDIPESIMANARYAELKEIMYYVEKSQNRK